MGGTFYFLVGGCDVLIGEDLAGADWSLVLGSAAIDRVSHRIKLDYKTINNIY